jgi:tetratricopeptide (TPR) repeat protein
LNPNKLNTATLILIASALMLMINSCSTKKNTWTRRTFHNVTAHYNVSWNGKVALAEGDRALREDVADDYNKVLPVFNYGNKSEATKIFPKMDRVIEKSSISIQKHSMYFGGEEKIKWVKYSYLMMGIGHFLKQDYISARRVFDYVAKEYEGEPISFDGYLWLAKTHIASERYEKAEATLNFLRSRQEEYKFPKSVVRNLPMVEADFFLAQENYDAAYSLLERGLELGNKRHVVTRAEFILAQINQLDGDLKRATHYYKKVIKKNPNYIMDFEARINMAQCYDEGTGDSKNIYKVLNKMVKDYKNQEFLDQIYYALAHVAIKDGHMAKAIDYLKLSVSSSIADDYQKSTSSLELADIFFERGDYLPAQAYYDTAVTFLPEDYPDYLIIQNKATVLSEMVIQVQAIDHQDSLQHLATLNTEELNTVIDGLIEEYRIQKEQELEEQEMLASGDVTMMDKGKRPMPGGQPLGGSAKWYFYNPSALSFGRSEFKKKWGNRKLEDNWRLSDKRLVMQAFKEEVTVEGETGVADSTQALADDPENREYYLVDIPLTPEKMEASNEIVIEAYKILGFLYLEELNDTANALATYLEFQERFPNNKYRLESWYALYKIYNEQGDQLKAEQYKNFIIGNYPESDYAKVIIDPNYYVNESKERGQASGLYSKAFRAFEREQYFRVINYAERGIAQYPEDTALVPKFMYLRAISLGKIDVPDTLYAALDKLVMTYPSSSVSDMARDVLKMLQQEFGLGNPTDDTTGESDKGPSKYTYNADDVHMVIVIVNSQKVEANALKVRMSDFKSKYFRLESLRIKSLMLDNQRTLITIGNFPNKPKSENFYTAVKNDEYVLSGMDAKDYELFMISVGNYPAFYRDKDVKSYKEFFTEYYSIFEE